MSSRSGVDDIELRMARGAKECDGAVTSRLANSSTSVIDFTSISW